MEATGSLRNFRVQAEIHGTDEASAFRMAVEELLSRLLYRPPPPPVRKLAALHASSRSKPFVIKPALPEQGCQTVYKSRQIS